jgi:hypothetical protein
MTIYQAQPNRTFPSLIPFLKNGNNPIGYELDTQFVYNSIEDYNFMYSNKYSYWHYQPTLIRSSKDEGFEPISIRLKEKHILNNNITNIDYMFGVFESKYLADKKSSDFSFTVIDHPINQILNFFFYIKYNKRWDSQIEKYGYILNKSEEQLDLILKSYKEREYETSGILEDQDGFDYRYTKDFYIDFLQSNRNKTYEDAAELFREVNVKEYVYALIALTSFKKINHEYEWIDYFISNPTLKDLISYRGKKLSYPQEYLRAKFLYKNHDFYGIMNSKKNLLKSLYIISKKSKNIFFTLSHKFTEVNPMKNFSYRLKELNSILEEDIDLFNKHKEILEKTNE